MTRRIAKEQIERELLACRRVAALLPGHPLALVDTYGCQQNEADSERLRGYLREMGCGFTEEENEADIIVINTCAIREHAENRVLGNVGALVHTKRRRPGQLICLCGCMMNEPHRVEKVKESYRHVDLVFPPQELWRFPSLLEQVCLSRRRLFAPAGEDAIAEGVPVVRRGSVKAWVSVMYGCNNFCSYCIVPHVRGRERSRRPEDILRETAELVEQGYKDITLLGQNVNSYGRDLETPMDFAALLRQVDAIPGDFLIRFMTSHPKDASPALFAAMAECKKVAPHLHLPVQAGSSRVLREMNRGYTREQYLDQVARLRGAVPDIVLTSDIIVGFPGETEEEFRETLSLVREVGYDALFTFLYSPRVGTPAAALPDPVSREEKSRWFDELVAVQNAISAEKHAAYVGQTVPVLVDGEGREGGYPLTGRTPGGRLVHLNGDAAAIGSFRRAAITEASTWALFGTLV